MHTLLKMKFAYLEEMWLHLSNVSESVNHWHYRAKYSHSHFHLPFVMREEHILQLETKMTFKRYISTKILHINLNQIIMIMQI